MLSTFADELEQARYGFITNMGRTIQLGTFIDIASIAFIPRSLGRTAYLESCTTDEIKGFTLLFPDLEEYIRKYHPREGYWRWSKTLPSKMKRLMYQLRVVLLVTIFETFIGDVLRIVFKYRPECLSSERQITSREVVELGDYDSIIDQLASKRVADILSGDWQKIVDEFVRLFNIDLSEEINTNKMTEIFEIRHIVVHNVGIIDERFMKKVKSSRWGIRYRINEEIKLNQTVMEHIEYYVDTGMECIYDRVLEKFGLLD